MTTNRDWEGKTVLVRTDFNVPVGENGSIEKSEAWRIEAGLQTIEWLSNQGARVVILSHIGRDPETSLRAVADYINQETAVQCGFVPEAIGSRVTSMVKRMGNGQVIMLENIRQDEREIANDITLADEWAELADFYINDAFSASHRDHASIVGLPKLLPAYIGIQFALEIAGLDRVRNPKHPLVMVLGGSKFATKLPVIDHFLDKAEKIFIGGAIAHSLFTEQGYELGRSLVDSETDVSSLMSRDQIMTPSEVVVQRGSELHEIEPSQVGLEDKIIDLGHEAITDLRPFLTKAATIVWNGPLGLYEEGYDAGTRELIELLSEVSAYKVVGGGDTVTVIREAAQEDAFDFISTAGGAMLEYLATGILAGIEAIEKSQ